MLARITSATLAGIEAQPVDVEVDLSKGLPVFTIVGLPDLAVRESRERIMAAFKNSGLEFPHRRITVNLAPADLRKAGTAYDLPIAVALLAAMEHGGRRLAGKVADGGLVAVGELGLDGSLRPVRGALSMAMLARERGATAFLLPEANAAEAGLLPGTPLVPLASLAEVLDWLLDRGPARPVHPRPDLRTHARSWDHLDMGDVRGQIQARRALEVAVAGGHNLLLIGPPGSGKTMLARRLPTLLPTMELEEALETTRIHSVAGRLPHGRPLLLERPFRAPHHTISDSGLIGGGPRALPGEISLAHNGVLFLDELPEFRRNALEALRQPLEERHVLVHRAMHSYRYPADALVVAALNPCPCGHLGDARRRCACSDHDVRAYRARVSGPLLDRFDLHIEMPAVAYEELAAQERGEPSLPIRMRVATARGRQADRFGPAVTPPLNARMSPAQVDQWAEPDPEGRRLLHRAMDAFGLSARAHHRILKVARTIADLAGAETLAPGHIAEAIQYRCLDREVVVA